MDNILKINHFIIGLLILVGSYMVYKIWSNVEGFNEQAGQFCTTCSGKTFNQCSDCFNCGFCVDQFGNGSCIGGDHKGPWNKERCARWYSGNPYTFMKQMNDNYKCSYGPKASNRIIGV